jgi:hypothetical protein
MIPFWKLLTHRGVDMDARRRAANAQFTLANNYAVQYSTAVMPENLSSGVEFKRDTRRDSDVIRAVAILFEGGLTIDRMERLVGPSATETRTFFDAIFSFIRLRAREKDGRHHLEISEPLWNEFRSSLMQRENDALRVTGHAVSADEAVYLSLVLLMFSDSEIAWETLAEARAGFSRPQLLSLVEMGKSLETIAQFTRNGIDYSMARSMGGLDL